MRERWLAAALVAAWIAGAACTREVSDEDLMVRPVSHGPWAVEGIVLGSPAATSLARLGAPDRSLPAPRGGTQLQWISFHQIGVTVDAAGRVAEISGGDLTDRAGRVVVWSSASEADVRAILPSARVAKSYRPKGSGVISLGRELAGTSYTVEDDLGTYTLVFSADGQLGGVTARHRPAERP